MKPDQQKLLVEALAFALESHGDQTRKGKGVPYASHLLQVAGLVLEHGGDIEQATAALLHDVVEDTGASIEDVRRRTNENVAAIVRVCTDTFEGDTPELKSDWEVRKQRYLENLRAANSRTLLVVACDKLHNLSNMVADLRSTGPGFLDRFNARPSQLLWYFESVREILHGRVPQSLVRELDLNIDSFRPFATYGVSHFPPSLPRGELPSSGGPGDSPTGGLP